MAAEVGISLDGGPLGGLARAPSLADHPADVPEHGGDDSDDDGGLADAVSEVSSAIERLEHQGKLAKRNQEHSDLLIKGLERKLDAVLAALGGQTAS